MSKILYKKQIIKKVQKTFDKKTSMKREKKEKREKKGKKDREKALQN